MRSQEYYREERCAYQKEYRKNNLEKIRQQKVNYRERNKETLTFPISCGRGLKHKDWLKRQVQQEQQEQQLREENYILCIITSFKQDTISGIYYDRSGFGSKATTLQDAKKKDASITKEDVEEFGENSFVAPHAKFEYRGCILYKQK